MILRLRINIRGAVQGVGFRPFIYRLATEANLNGFILNSSSGVLIEVEGEKNILDNFLLRIEKEKPKVAIINNIEFSFLDSTGYTDFKIRQSSDAEDKTTLILPDIAVCDDCLKEMFDPEDRRYLYPFINCTNCGPRFSIIESIPYDRPNTSMKDFEMCDDCRREYEDPTNRRFHAQPIACPKCGPNIVLWDNHGNIISSNNEALLISVQKIKDGKIIALKGIGGYQLIADATNDKAVNDLRIKKEREEKPFALMFPDLQSIKTVCEVSKFEERLLKSAEAPIVLLKKKFDNLKSSYNIAKNVAPDNPYLGVMLPYSPLHHLLLYELNIPIIATSGNLSEEPIAIDEEEALEKLSGIADYFLTYNRKIVRHADDSIVRVILGREMVMRRARGYAPLPLNLPNKDEEIILAVGGHLKNTVALNIGDNIFLSQHIGDLSTKESIETFENVINDFQLMYEVTPQLVVTDLHPEYVSTKYAKEKYDNVISIQHHEAHVAACIAENQIKDEVLGVSLDGTGYGYDGTIWGGEFFHFTVCSIKHVAQLRQFYLPGGDKAIKEPRRSALGLLYEMYGDDIFEMSFDFLNSFSNSEKNNLRQMLDKKINTQRTSSTGRLFDAVAAILNINHKMSYEGQAAMMLEFSTLQGIDDTYPFNLVKKEITIIDWEKTIKSILADVQNKISLNIISTKFHNTMTEIITNVALQFKIENVALSGGVFQNAYLLERTVNRLNANNFKPYWHQRIPTNDGGISVGQISVAMKYNKIVKEK